MGTPTCDQQPRDQNKLSGGRSNMGSRILTFLLRIFNLNKALVNIPTPTVSTRKGHVAGVLKFNQHSGGGLALV